MTRPCRPLRSRSRSKQSPRRTGPTRGHRVDRGGVLLVERELERPEILLEMAGRRGADDRGRHHGPIQNPAQRHLGDAPPVLVGHALQGAEQFLKQPPPAEVVDDQLVLGEGAVLETVARLARPDPVRRQEAPGERAVAQLRNSALPASGDQRPLRPQIQRGVLRLVGDHRNPRVRQLQELRGIEVTRADPGDLAGASDFVQPQSGLHEARDSVRIPPVILHQVQSLDPQPPERAIDDPLHVLAAKTTERPEVRHVFGVYLNVRRHPRTRDPKLADQFLDPGVDVGAVEGGDPCLDEGGHVSNGVVAVDGPMSPGQMPSALDQTRDLVAGLDGEPFDAHAPLPSGLDRVPADGSASRYRSAGPQTRDPEGSDDRANRQPGSRPARRRSQRTAARRPSSRSLDLRSRRTDAARTGHCRPSAMRPRSVPSPLAQGERETPGSANPPAGSGKSAAPPLPFGTNSSCETPKRTDGTGRHGACPVANGSFVRRRRDSRSQNGRLRDRDTGPCSRPPSSSAASAPSDGSDGSDGHGPAFRRSAVDRTASCRPPPVGV